MISKATLVHVNNERKLGAPIQGAIQPSVKSHHLHKKKWENRPCFGVRIVDPKMGSPKEKQVRWTPFWVPKNGPQNGVRTLWLKMKIPNPPSLASGATAWAALSGGSPTLHPNFSGKTATTCAGHGQSRVMAFRHAVELHWEALLARSTTQTWPTGHGKGPLLYGSSGPAATHTNELPPHSGKLSLRAEHREFQHLLRDTELLRQLRAQIGKPAAPWHASPPYCGSRSWAAWTAKSQQRHQDHCHCTHTQPQLARKALHSSKPCLLPCIAASSFAFESIWSGAPLLAELPHRPPCRASCHSSCLLSNQTMNQLLSCLLNFRWFNGLRYMSSTLLTLLFIFIIYSSWKHLRSGGTFEARSAETAVEAESYKQNAWAATIWSIKRLETESALGRSSLGGLSTGPRFWPQNGSNPPHLSVGPGFWFWSRFGFGRCFLVQVPFYPYRTCFTIQTYQEPYSCGWQP